MTDQAAAIIADAIKTLAWCLFWGMLLGNVCTRSHK